MTLIVYFPSIDAIIADDLTSFPALRATTYERKLKVVRGYHPIQTGGFHLDYEDFTVGGAGPEAHIQAAQGQVLKTIFNGGGIVDWDREIDVSLLIRRVDGSVWLAERAERSAPLIVMKWTFDVPCRIGSGGPAFDMLHRLAQRGWQQRPPSDTPTGKSAEERLFEAAVGATDDCGLRSNDACDWQRA